MRLFAPLALLLIARVAPATEAAGLASLGGDVAAQAARGAPPASTLLVLRVEGPAALARAAELEVASALRGAGFRGVVNAAAADEADARLDLRISLQGERLVAAGDLRPVRENFFTGRSVVEGAVIAASVRADPAALLLAGGKPGPLVAEVAPFATLPERPLALAVGDLDGDGVPEVAAVGATRLIVLGADGGIRLAQPLAGAPGARPLRDPVAAMAIEGGRLRVSVPGAGVASEFALRGGALEPVADLPAGVAPLPGGNGSYEPGTNRLLPALVIGGAKVELSSPARAVAVHGAAIAWVDDGGTVRIGEEPALRDGGDSLALADLDGDGTAELVATSSRLAPPDEIRVVRVGGGGAVELRGAGVLGGVLLRTGTAGDLGAGEEALLGGVAADGSGAIVRVRRVAR